MSEHFRRFDEMAGDEFNAEDQMAYAVKHTLEDIKTDEGRVKLTDLLWALARQIKERESNNANSRFFSSELVQGELRLIPNTSARAYLSGGLVKRFGACKLPELKLLSTRKHEQAALAEEAANLFDENTLERYGKWLDRGLTLGQAIDAAGK